MCLMLAAVLAAQTVLAGLGDRIERGLGDALARSLEATSGTWSAPDTIALLRSIAADLFSLRSRDFAYRLVVLDDFEVNALALPGGHIYLYRGLIAHAHSTDEIAAVTAHEMGHQEDRDFQRVVARQLLWLSLAGVLRRRSRGAADAALIAGVLNSLRHSRRQEAQADAQAVRLCLLAGYQPSALIDFLTSLRRQRSDWFARIFLTHPEPARRRELVAERTSLWLRGHPRLAERLCLRLCARGRPAAALALARTCARWPGHRSWTGRFIATTEATVAALAAASMPSLPPPTGAAKRLWAALEKVRSDGRIRQALQLAQAIDPEADDWRYLGALSAVVASLMRLQCALDAGFEAAYRADRCRPAPDGLRVCASAAAGLRRAGWMLAALLAELVASGPGEPLGSITSAKLACLWGQIRVADRSISRAQSAFDALLADATQPTAARLVDLLQRASSCAAARCALDPLAATITGRRDAAALLSRWRKRLQGKAKPVNNTAEDVYLLARLLAGQLSSEIQLAGELTGQQNRGQGR